MACGARGKVMGRQVAARHGTEVVAGLQLSPVGVGIHWSPYNWNYTVTWQLNSVPYYLSGVKLAQTLRDRHQVQLWIVNGWQLLADNRPPPSSRPPNTGGFLLLIAVTAGVGWLNHRAARELQRQIDDLPSDEPTASRTLCNHACAGPC